MTMRLTLHFDDSGVQAVVNRGGSLRTFGLGVAVYQPKETREQATRRAIADARNSLSAKRRARKAQ